MRKGVSPLIATVLLIAFTIAVAGIISVWLTQFTTTTTNTVSTQGNVQILCGTGGIQLSSVSYCSNFVSGQVVNTGNIGLGNISMTILYTNASRELVYISNNGGTLSKSSACCGNLSLLPAEKYSFNFSIGGTNYDTLRVTTNCTTVRVSDEVVNSQGGIARIC